MEKPNKARKGSVLIMPRKREKLPDSAFADTKHRVFPLIDAPYVRGAIMFFRNNVMDEHGKIRPNHDRKRLKTIHDRIFAKAKEFGIHHKHKCELCGIIKEKVVFS